MTRTQVILSAFIVTTAVVPLAVLAQTGAAAHAAVEKQIIASERAINDAFAKGDVKAFHAGSIAPDAMSIDPAGISKVTSPDMDKMIATAKISTWNIDGSQFQWLGETTVVHLYRWTGKGTVDGQAVHSPTWASTIWMNRAGKWLAVFHQETDAMPPPPPPPARSGAAPAKK